MPFRNPYHFVPVSGNMPKNIPSPEGQPLSSAILGHRTHDRYHNDTLSGRIICRLTTVGPIVIGDKQPPRADGYTGVGPFERNGEPAIPASTLRGCISAIAEAASNSALRVLHNDYYSRRVLVQGEVDQEPADFSALGMIVEDCGELRLRPLALPTLKKPAGGYFTVPSKYRTMFPPSNGNPETRFKAFCYDSATLLSAPNGYSHEHPDYWYAKIQGSYVMGNDHRITGNNGHLARQNQNILLGLTTIGDPVRRPPEGQENDYVRGILRVISAPNRTDIPLRNKLHEMFIPYPPGIESSPTFPIAWEALDRFERLAEDRETENKRRAAKDPPEDLVPYVLKGAEQLKDRSDAYTLKDGDIVFFVPNSDGDKVEKVWISQIWREEIPGTEPNKPGQTYDFFARVNQELLPFHKGRQFITPAEALFGFVQENEKGSGDLCRALASRIRFAEGRLVQTPDQGCYYPEIPLRILASPKPPCPSFYFRRNNLPANPTAQDCYISKQDLHPNTHRPQGRKFYLNRVVNANLLDSCRTHHEDEHQNQKNRVTPLRKGCGFVFHIDFENLSRWELGLLLYALRPTPDFHHKIGMGKPLGLGTVEVDLAGIFYIDRSVRYSEDGFGYGAAGRYHRYWIDSAYRPVGGEIPESAREVFDAHGQAVMQQQVLADDSGDAPDRVRAVFEGTLEPAIRKALAKVGQPNVGNVSYPLASHPNGPGWHVDPEVETFRWFVNNDSPDNQERQGLLPLEYGNDSDIVRLQEN